MLDDYGVLIVGTLAPFCLSDPRGKTANDNSSDHGLRSAAYDRRRSGEVDEQSVRHPTTQSA